MASIINYTFALCLSVLFCGDLLAAANQDDFVKEFKKNVTSIFKNCDDTLQYIQREFLRIPAVCTDSIEYLNELAQTLIGDNDRLSQTVSVYLSQDCIETDKLKTSFFTLKNVFGSLIKAEILSDRYNSLKQKHTFVLDRLYIGLNGSFPKSQQRLLITSLKKALDRHADKSANVLEYLETHQRRINENNAFLAASYLVDRKFRKAHQTLYNKITNFWDYIKTSIKLAYKNDEANFKLIYVFVQMYLPEKYRIYGYQGLFERLGKTNNSTHFWTLARTVMSNTQYDLSNIMFKEVKERVQNNRLDRVIADINENSEDSGFQYISKTLISAFFSLGKTRITKALDFMHKLTRLSDKLFFFEKFVDELRWNRKLYGKEMTVLAYEFIKLKIENKKTKNSTSLKTLEQMFPNDLQEMLYKNLCIQNVRSREFLHAGLPLPEDDRRRAIYASKKRDSLGSFLWNFHFIKNGTKILIENSKYGEHIFLEKRKDEGYILRSWVSGPFTNIGEEAEFSLYFATNGRHAIIHDLYKQQLYSSTVDNSDAIPYDDDTEDYVDNDDDDADDDDDDDEIKKDENVSDDEYDDDDLDTDDESNYGSVSSEKFTEKFSYRSRWNIGLCRLPHEFFLKKFIPFEMEDWN